MDKADNILLVNGCINVNYAGSYSKSSDTLSALKYSVLDEIMSDIDTRLKDKQIELDTLFYNCEDITFLYDEEGLLDEDMAEDFLDYLLEQPEFEYDNIKENLDDIDIEECSDEPDLYDFDCCIDIDLMPIAERYAKEKGLNLTADKDTRDDDER